MARIRIQCKACGTAFQVDARHAGKTGRCPNADCGAAIRVPRPTTAPAPRQAAPASLPPRLGGGARRPPQGAPRGRRQRLSWMAAGGAAALVFVAVAAIELWPAGHGAAQVAGPPLLLTSVAAAAPAGPPEDPAFKEALVPFLKTYSIDCHGPDLAEAEVNFAAYDSVESMRNNRKKWNQVAGLIRIGAMPPVDHDVRPAAEERKKIVEWLDATLNRVDCQLVDDPGHVTVRRLNRVEYDNTIRDLVGVDFHPAADFPSDDVGNGFDNQGEVLSVPPLLIEKYLDAAEQIADKAIVADPESKLAVRRDGGTLPSVGEISKRFKFQKGEYLLRTEVTADQAGPELAKTELRFDGKPLQTFEVQGAGPNVFEATVNIDGPGEKKFAVAFLNDYYDEKNPDSRQRDRNLHVNWLEIRGPKGGLPELPETHTRIVFTTPRDGKSVRQAAEEVLTRFAGRAYRRPVDPVEVNRLVNLVEMAVKQGEPFERGVSYAVQAVLVSPNFLFRVEDDAKPEGGKERIGDYELASRLSFFLWSTMPDQELLDLAAKGELSKPEVVSTQVRRMLADPKSEALVKNFFGQWLNLRNLDEADPDPQKFPWWNSQLQTAMRTETEMLCSTVMKEDRRVLDLLDADFTFVNPRLAELYGVKWNDQDPKELYYGYKGNRNDVDYKGNRRSGFYTHEDEFVRVPLPEGRRGVLTHASILTLTSNPGETSPVKRGKWILDNVFGTPPPPAPPGVPSFDVAKKAKPNATLREQLALHRAHAGCASCHDVMDPLGLGFENFDAIGRWREKDGDLPIDPSGKLEDGRTFRGAIELIGLIKQQEDQIARHFVEKLMTYALGRGLEYYDSCAVDSVTAAAKKDGYKFSAVVTAAVLSDPFRMRRGDGRRP